LAAAAMLPVLHVSTNVSSERRSKPRDDLMAPAKPCPASIPPAPTAYSRKLYLSCAKVFLGLRGSGPTQKSFWAPRISTYFPKT
jgi:hypothetical protein